VDAVRQRPPAHHSVALGVGEPDAGIPPEGVRRGVRSSCARAHEACDRSFVKARCGP